MSKQIAGSVFRIIAIIAVLVALVGLSPSATPASSAVNPASCTDSDGGLIYDTKGFVEGFNAQGYAYKKYDYCETGAYEGYLMETWCNGTTAWPKRFKCANGCSDGACSLFPPGCTDADGDRYAAGGDQCGPVDCDDTNPAVNPGAAEVCGNGLDDNCNGLTDSEEPSCASCQDTDGGLEYYLQGSVTDGTGNTYTDACLNGSQLQEYTCSAGGGAQPSTYTCPSGCTAGACSAPNILVIGWDGTQKDHLSQCYNKQLPECSNGLPNLAALSGGQIFTSVTTSGRSETKPGWTQLFTGYNANVTRVYDNFNYLPIPEGYTVFEKVENYFGQENVVTFFLSGKNEHTGGACVGDPTYRSGQPVIEDRGQPWCLTKTHLDTFENNLKENVNTGNRALALLEANRNKFFFGLVNFWDPDSYGHFKGENSVEYSRAIIDGDYWLGRIVAKLQELGIYDDTLIYVVSDHGFDENTNTHGNAPYGILASNDPLLMRSGDRKDFTPTLLDRYGISPGASGNIPAVDGFSMYAFPPITCVSEGGAFIDYPGAPACCSGLALISLSKTFGAACMDATGGAGNNSGYCTYCGNNKCDVSMNENRCNCPADCKY